MMDSLISFTKNVQVQLGRDRERMKKIFAFLLVASLLLGCGSKDPESIIIHGKMTKWPSIYIKESVDFFIHNPVWSSENSRSVNVSGKVPFRGDSANVTFQARLQENDSLWTTSWLLDGRPADSLETEELYDGMAFAFAEGTVAFMKYTLDHPFVKELDKAAQVDLGIAGLKCFRYVMSPQKFKTLDSIASLKFSIAQGECFAKKASHPDVVEMYSGMVRTSRMMLMNVGLPEPINTYENNLMEKDSVLLNYLKSNGVNVDSLLSAKSVSITDSTQKLPSGAEDSLRSTPAMRMD